MKFLLLLLVVACNRPIPTGERWCDYSTHPERFTWHPVLNQAGDTVTWFGVCTE